MPKPFMIFDGDCNFCRFWAARGQARTGERVTWAPYQQVHAQFPKISIPAFQSAVQFVDETGTVFSGAEAIFRCLSVGKSTTVLLWWYENVPGFSAVSEFVYRFVARHRSFFSL